MRDCPTGAGLENECSENEYEMAPLIKHCARQTTNIPLLCQLLLQFLVPALMVAGQGDDNDEHEDQQPPSHRTHDDHQHVLHDLGPWLTLCTVESLDISFFFLFFLVPCVTLDNLSAGR